MTNPFQKSSPGLIRAATQPAIAFSNQPYEEHAAPQSPLELHDESGIDYSNPQQPTLLEPQRQGVVQSLQDIPYPVPPNQPNRLLFRQESVQGSRVLQVNSPQRTPEPSRIPGRTTNPSAFARQAAHIEINVPENPSTTQNEEIPGSTAELQENHENSLALQDPQAESIKKAASLRLWTEFSFNAFMLISYVLGYLYIDEVIPANAVFGVSFGFLLVAMLGPLRRKGLYADFDRVDVLFSLAHLFCLGAFLVLACLKINGVQVPLTHVALGGLLILFCSCCKSSIDEPSPFKASLLLLKLFIWIQLIILSIRIDGLPLPWGTVFIPAYFTLVVLAFSSILVILGSLFAFFNVIRQEGMSAQLLLGSLWYIFNALYTGIWFAILNGVVTFLDDPNEKTYIHIALRVGIIHSGALFLFTAFLWRTLLKFQEFEVHSEMLIPEESEVPDGYDYENQNQNTRIRFQVVKDNKTYLTMISSTFYSYVGKHLKNNNANNSNEIKNKIENAKMHKRAHGLALNVPHHTDIANNYQNQVSSPVKVKSRNLDFSDGDIKTSAVPSLMLKKGESMRSNAESCVVCFDNVPNGVFMDCGHGGVCYECALDSWKKSDNCVFCRQRINKVLKIVSCRPLNITKVVETTTKVVENV